ncbi:MAG: ABC transporter ATP-binding protein [Planctomycetes bacterium]|nr:ABC transporter ATP-binding protein [Planctomycetota bacterium]
MIEIRDLTKAYGDLRAVQSLNLTVHPGDLFGFIGPNGAGKTTTLRILATLLKPTSGSVRIDGLDVARSPMAVRRIMGFMPDRFGLYDELTVEEYLAFFHSLYELPHGQMRERVDNLLTLVNFTEHRKLLVGTLSKGQRQILGLARTLIHNPKVLLLDEPAEGLDPGARIELRVTLEELRKLGKTIVLSSHILRELSELCNRIAIVEKGRLVVAGDKDEILRRFSPRRMLAIELPQPHERVRELLAAIPGVQEVLVPGPGRVEVAIDGGDETVAAIVKGLATAGIAIAGVNEKKIDIEDLFMQLTKGDVA